MPLADVNSCFKLFRTSFLKRFPIQSDGDFVHTELVAKATFLTSIMDEVALTPKPDAVPSTRRYRPRIAARISANPSSRFRVRTACSCVGHHRLNRLPCHMNAAQPRFLFVTGKLAEPRFAACWPNSRPRAGFEYDVAVLNITVAALMTTNWVAGTFLPASPPMVYSCPASVAAKWKRSRGPLVCPAVLGPERPPRPARVFRQASGTAARLRQASTSRSSPRSTTAEEAARSNPRRGPAVPRERGRRDRPRLRPGRHMGR